MNEEKPEKIISPCIGECVMNKDGYCTGCFRSITEIAAWAGMTNEERKMIMANLAKRKKIVLQS